MLDLLGCRNHIDFFIMYNLWSKIITNEEGEILRDLFSVLEKLWSDYEGNFWKSSAHLCVNTASHKKACKRTETSEAYDWFYYKESDIYSSFPCVLFWPNFRWSRTQSHRVRNRRQTEFCTSPKQLIVAPRLRFTTRRHPQALFCFQGHGVTENILSYFYFFLKNRLGSRSSLSCALRFFGVLRVWSGLVPPTWPWIPILGLLFFLPAQPSVCEAFRFLCFSD